MVEEMRSRFARLCTQLSFWQAPKAYNSTACQSASRASVSCFCAATRSTKESRSCNTSIGLFGEFLRRDNLSQAELLCTPSWWRQFSQDTSQIRHFRVCRESRRASRVLLCCCSCIGSPVEKPGAKGASANRTVEELVMICPNRLTSGASACYQLHRSRPKYGLFDVRAHLPRNQEPSACCPDHAAKEPELCRQQARQGLQPGVYWRPATQGVPQHLL